MVEIINKIFNKGNSKPRSDISPTQHDSISIDPQERKRRNIRHAVEAILNGSGRSAIIRVETMDPADIVSVLSNYDHNTPDGIISKNVEQRSNAGMVLSGLTSEHFSSNEHGLAVQDFVRKLMQEKREQNRMYSVVLLADELPDPDVFESRGMNDHAEASIHPWGNGPFPTYREVWSLGSSSTGQLEIVPYRRERRSVADPYTWVSGEKQQFDFDI